MKRQPLLTVDSGEAETTFQSLEYVIKYEPVVNVGMGDHDISVNSDGEYVEDGNSKQAISKHHDEERGVIRVST